MTHPTDLTDRFLLENLDIRGQVVRLGPLWRAILSRREYPDAFRQLLGEFAAIAVLIGSGLKHPGRAVLQVMGQGPVSLAVADCTQDLALRAMLKIDPKAAIDPSALTIHDFFPTGRLVITIENTQSGRHFQSIVPLEGVTLEDVFVVPSRSGLRQVRMRPEEYFGEVFFLKEGWNAGRDTVEDVSFVGAFPVSEPEFLHMWMNHPSNGESAHILCRVPAVGAHLPEDGPVFLYYLWGAAAPWEKGLEELRRRNLITAAR